MIIKLIESHQLFKRKLHRKDSSELKALLRIRKNLKLSNDILYRKSYTDNSSSRKVLWQLVVPKAYRARALVGCHDDVGHQGTMRTISLLRERFFWPGMQEEATQYVVKCSRCLRRKTTPQVAPLQPIYVTQPLELVHMDYLSLEPSKGNIENVLVITDHLPGMHWLILVKHKQHKPQLESYGIISFAIMDSQKNSLLTKVEILNLI